MSTPFPVLKFGSNSDISDPVLLAFASVAEPSFLATNTYEKETPEVGRKETVCATSAHFQCFPLVTLFQPHHT